MPPVKIGISTTFDSAGAAAAKVAIGAVGAESTKAEKSLLSYAATTAKLQRSAGDLAGAEKTLSSALSQVDRSSKEALAAEAQLTATTNALTKSVSGASAGMQVLPRTIAGLSHEAQSAVTNMVSLGAALAALKGAADLAQVGAGAEAASSSFDRLATSAGLSGDKLLTSIKAAAGGTVSEAKLIESANTGLLLAGSKLATELPHLLEIARASAQATGQDVGFVFDSLVKGISRGSPQIIDNAGITLNAAAAFDTYAASIGKTADQLTKNEQQTATMNAVVSAGAAIVKQVGVSNESSAATFQRLGAESDNAKVAVGKLLAELGKMPAKVATEVLVNVTNGLTQLADANKQIQEFSVRALEGADSLEEYEQRVQNANDQLSSIGARLNSLSPAAYEYAKALQSTGVSAADAFAKASTYHDILERVTDAQTAAGTSGGDWANVLGSLGQRAAEVASTSDYNKAAVDSLSQAYASGNLDAAQFSSALDVLTQRNVSAANAATIEALETQRLGGAKLTAAQITAQAEQAHRMETQALVDSTTKSAEAAVQAQKLADFQATLANLGGQVAGGFMTAGQAALLMANKYNIAIEEALKLINLQAQLGQASVNKQAFTDQRAGERSGGSVRSQGELDAQVAARKLATDHARQLQEANDRAALANAKTSGQKLTVLERQLAESTDDIQRVNIQSQIDQEKSGGSKRAGAKASGASKLETLEGNTSEKIQKIVADRDKKLADLDAKFATEQLENKRKLANDIANTAGNRRVSNEVDDLDLIGKHTPDEARKLNDRERAEADARKRSEANAEEARKKAEEGDAESADKIYQIREDANKQQEDLDRAYYEKQAELGKNPELQAALQQQYEEAQKAIQEQSDREVQQANDLAELKKAQREKEHDEIIAAAQDAANVAIGHAQRMSDSIIKATATAGDQGSNNLKKIGDAVNAIPANKTVTVTIKQEGSTSTGGSSSGGGTKAAGGGTFMSNGPTTLTVGDNPGGREIVTVTPVGGRGQTTVGPGMVKMAGGGVLDAGGGYTTPVATGSNEGTKKVNASKAADAIKSQIEQQRDVIALLSDLIKLRHDLEEEIQNGQPFNVGFVQALAAKAALFLQFVQGNLIPITKKQGEAFSLYTDAAASAISILGDVASLRHDLTDAMKDQPFNIDLIRGLSNRAALFLSIVQAELVPVSEAQGDALSRYQDAVSTSVSVLKDVADLRKELSGYAEPPIDMALVTALAGEAKRVTEIVQGVLLPLTEAQGKAFSAWSDAASASIGIIKDASDLSKTLTENGNTPISMAVVARLAGEAKRTTEIVQGALLPETENQTKALSAWADAAGSSISVIKDVSDLGKTLKENESTPISMTRVTQLAGEAKRATQIVRANLLPLTEAQGAALSTWGDAVGASVGVIKDVSDLGRAISEGAGYPISAASIQKLAGDAVRITRAVQGTLTPTTEAQADALSTWGNAVSASVGALKSVTDLSGNLFADYTSPSNAQLNRLATDAKRVTDAMGRAAATYSTTGIAAGQAYAESVGATFTAFKDGLLFFEALNSGDYNLNVGALRKFEVATVQTLGVVRRLGAEAIKIPAADIAALGITTAALSAQSEALIKLAAVPFGDIQPAAAGLAAQANTLLNGASRGGTPITVNIYNPPPTMNVAQVAAQAATLINQQLQSRR